MLETIISSDIGLLLFFVFALGICIITLRYTFKVNVIVKELYKMTTQNDIIIELLEDINDDWEENIEE